MKKGVGASSGFGIGKVFIIDEPEIPIDIKNIADEEISDEITKLDMALKKSEKQLDDLLQETLQKQEKETADIIDAHIILLQDPILIEEINNKINSERIKAEYALKKIFDEKIEIFNNMDDPYLKERAIDIKDIGERILKNLLNIPFKNLSNFQEDVILVGKDITPSQMAVIDQDHVKGIVTEVGGKTSHTAIMSRSMGIPAVLGIKGVVSELNEGSFIALDGTKGLVELELSTEKLNEYKEKINNQEKLEQELMGLKESESKTKDGRIVELYANIAKPEDTTNALYYGAEGVGLFRTEFLFMDRSKLPSEEEQFKAYKKAVQGMNGKSVIIRTLDIGGDKELPYLNLPKEENPFLGWRAIRISLEEIEMFKTQLRAILRASAFGKIRIMYPMIASVQEVRKANSILDEVKNELRADKVTFNENIEVGIMIEIPSAAISADLIIEEVDFFSIGTNDLTQYTLATDRMNEKVSDIYNSFHPAVLRLIKNVIEVSHKSGKFTGMCGEFAGNPISTIMLLGMGLDEFSMNPSSILKIRKLINSVDLEFAEMILDKVMKMDDPKAIEDYLKEKTSSFLDEIYF